MPKSKVMRFVRLPIDGGNVPDSHKSCNSKDFSAVIVSNTSGSVPVSVLPVKSRCVSAVKLPIDAGMVPEMSHVPAGRSSRYVKLTRFPMESGIIPPAPVDTVPAFSVAKIPVMYPALLHLKSPDPAELAPYPVQYVVAHVESRG